MSHHREIAYALLRVTVGIMFLFFGVGKLLGGVGGFTGGMVERFAGSFLPSPFVELFAYALPFAEVVIGTLLVLGLFNVATLTLAGLHAGAQVWRRRTRRSAHGCSKRYLCAGDLCAAVVGRAKRLLTRPFIGI